MTDLTIITVAIFASIGVSVATSIAVSLGCVISQHKKIRKIEIDIIDGLKEMLAENMKQK